MKFGFIGAGKVGFSLGKYLKENNIDISGYYSKNQHSSREAAIFTNTKQYNNLENLITYMNNGYILNIEKKKMLELKNNNAIISKTSQEISQEVGELIKIDIKNSVYSISNYMRQIQRLFDSNILRDWNEDIISIQKKVSGT